MNDPHSAIARINARLGRPLRVLHIGNIANNAYNNARIQRQYGIEADVLCYDYYHIMGCPEWEDEEFSGEVDAFLPDWFETSLRGWSRPDWFIQGPVNLCVPYLRAYRRGMPFTARLLRLHIEAEYWRMLQAKRLESGAQIRRMPARLHSASWLVGAFGLLRSDADIRYLTRELANPFAGRPPGPVQLQLHAIGRTLTNFRTRLATVRAWLMLRLRSKGYFSKRIAAAADF